MREALKAEKLLRVDRQLDPDLGVTRFLAEWQQSTGAEPSFLFGNVLGSAMPLLMNFPNRSALLTSLGVENRPGAIKELARRIAAPTPLHRHTGVSVSHRELPDLGALPLLRHQPRDAGKYLTSFVGSLTCATSGTTNLGFYRGMAAGPDTIALFMDPRTDAHRIVSHGFELADKVPITLFNGGPLASYLAGAAKIPTELDSFDAAARFAGHALTLTKNGYPAAPVDAEIIIEGHVTRQSMAEGPFGEFKGYYCKPTQSPVVQVDRILIREDAICLGLFCGKQSGLTLMALQNELFMYDQLTRAGFAIHAVSYPLASFGEYTAVIECAEPSRELIEAALDYDHRAKLIMAVQPGADPSKEMAIFPSEVVTRPYLRYGQQEGHRIGLYCDRRTHYDWVEL